LPNRLGKNVRKPQGDFFDSHYRQLERLHWSI